MKTQDISIALCTYNGAPFLLEQLESINNQSRPPDELVVCDDGSTDETLSILESFSLNSSYPVRIWVNERNLGSTKNFEKAISLCRCDIIVLCDQDDAWNSEKLKKIDSIFLARPRLGAVFSDADVVDSNLVPLGYTLWDSIGFSWMEKKMIKEGRSFDVLLRHNVVAGATLAFRGEYNRLILPIPDDWFHDAWIALLIAVVSEVAFIREPLIRYRQHSDNLIGGRKKTFSDQLLLAHELRGEAYLHEAKKFGMVSERIFASGETERCQAFLSGLSEKIRHLSFRSCIPGAIGKRIGAILTELLSLKYHRYSQGFRSVLKDLFFQSPPNAF